ncbi:undecaprenyl-diphosphate phosphatase [Candidatus Margulisiibacteriota bacterium]
MEIIWAIFLGVVQGATEFLPVSSSGHLVVMPYLLNLKLPELGFSVLLHFASLLAVVIYFWRKLWVMVLNTIEGMRQLFQKKKFVEIYQSNEGFRLVFQLIVATLCTIPLAIGFESMVSTAMEQPIVVAFFLSVTVVLLMIASVFINGRFRVYVPLWIFIIVGIAQGIAVFPGISRSGITIVAFLICGVQRKEAVSYAFLLAIPAFLGAMIFEWGDVTSLVHSFYDFVIVAVGFVVSFATSLGAIYLLVNKLSRRMFYVFVIYLVIMINVVLVKLMF